MKIKIQPFAAENFIAPVIDQLLASCTRKELRQLAVKYSIKRGRDKRDTLINLLNDGRVCVFVEIRESKTG